MTTLTDLVEVEAVGPDRYRAVTDSPLSRPTLFGGALVAQALRAAAASTDPEKHPHSLPATFVRAGWAGPGGDLTGGATPDGRSFLTRPVAVWRGERAVRTMPAAFPREEPSPEHQPPAALAVPYPAGALLAAPDGPVAPAGPPGPGGPADRSRRDMLGIDIVETGEPGEAR